ncbi:MAG: hypothetical protein AAGA93_26145 [Actinomycetota bacterium]
MTRRQNVSWLVAVVAMLAAGCGIEQSHSYIQSNDGSLSFRHPPDWAEVDVQALGLEWVTGIDASGSPSGEHATTFVQAQPFVVAQVLPLDQERHDQASRSVLRTLAIADGRDPIAGDDPTIRILFYEDVLDDRGFEGHHVRFEIDIDGDTAIAEHLAVLDPDRTRIQRLRVACTTVCFEANSAAIEDIFDSVRFR